MSGGRALSRFIKPYKAPEGAAGTYESRHVGCASAAPSLGDKSSGRSSEDLQDGERGRESERDCSAWALLK